jgi:hypothetical protein
MNPLWTIDLARNVEDLLKTIFGIACNYLNLITISMQFKSLITPEEEFS